MKGRCLTLALLASCAHLNPSTSLGVVVAPEPQTVGDTSYTRALELASRVARRNGLLPRSREYEGRVWNECFSLPGVEWVVCDRVSNDEIQLLFRAPGHLVLPALPEKIRLELSDSLRRRFGADRVRECHWAGDSCPRN